MKRKTNFYFARPQLATNLADSLQGKILFSDAINGVFLAAPRRTGKSTFLQTELKPALEASGVVVVYVDLWSDKSRDPGDLIAEAIGQGLSNHLGVVAKTVQKTGITGVSVGGVTINPTKIGKPDGATLKVALESLSELAKNSVALIVDEAQNALTSASGENTMAALKSARDQLNNPTTTNLMLIMSGSDRDKLLRLVNSNGAPFFGSRVQSMPLLDIKFIEHLVSVLEDTHPELRPLTTEVLWNSFQMLGNRPQIFISAIEDALNSLSDSRIRFENIVYGIATQQQKYEESQMQSSYLALKPLERAILWRLFEQHATFRPYDAEALKFYKEKTGKRFSAQQIQNAVDSMRDKTPALIWKSSRGEYALDDIMMQQWYQNMVRNNKWPPNDTELTF